METPYSAASQRTKELLSWTTGGETRSTPSPGKKQGELTYPQPALLRLSRMPLRKMSDRRTFLHEDLLVAFMLIQAENEDDFEKKSRRKYATHQSP